MRWKLALLLTVATLVAAGDVRSQTVAEPGRAMPFRPGEELEYAVSYGVVPAGRMELHVEDVERLDGRVAYHFVSEAESNRAVSFLYELDSHEEAWFDAEELYSLKYTRRTIENEKERIREYLFDQERHLRIEPDGETEATSPRAVDQLSMIYYLRLLPFEPGARFTLRNQADPEDNPIEIRVLKSERIRVPAGTFETYVLQLELQTDSGVFKKGGDNRIWVTADSRHIPVRITSKIGIGNFQAELVALDPGQKIDAAR